ncbi:MAG TPA: flippase, partial [Ignavibacteria bacterium]|nr:flippase [Ignavibacteria bacterium]
MKLIKEIFNSPTKKRLVENFFSLSFLQISNYLLPLITLPYLVRVLGPEKFGLLAFYQSFIQFFYIITDYGFNFSATRDISIHREDKAKISLIFCTVMIVKTILVLFSLFVVTIIVLTISKFSKEWLVIYLSFGFVIGQALFPRWFFQGVEKMKLLSIMSILAKLFFTVLVFIIIKKPSDYIYVPLLNSLGLILVGIISLIFVKKSFKVKIVKPSLAELKHQIKEGWHLFISTLATSLYTTANSFILGLFTNNTVVGYYSAAEKIIRAIQDLISPIFYTVYPYLSKLVNESREKALDFIKQILKYVSFFTFIISIIVFIFAEFISRIVLGNNFNNSIIIIKILTIIPFLGGINIILTSLTMLSFNYKKEFSKIIITAGLINVFSAFLLVPVYFAIGSAIAVI